MRDLRGETLWRTARTFPHTVTKAKKRSGGGVGIQLLSVYPGREEGGREPEIVFPAASLNQRGHCLGISNAGMKRAGGGSLLPREPSRFNKLLHMKELTTHLPQNVNLMKIKAVSDKKNNILLFFEI